MVGRTLDQSVTHCWVRGHAGGSQSQPEVKFFRNALWPPNLAEGTPDQSVMHRWVKGHAGVSWGQPEGNCLEMHKAIKCSQCYRALCSCRCSSFSLNLWKMSCSLWFLKAKCLYRWSWIAILTDHTNWHPFIELLIQKLQHTGIDWLAQRSRSKAMSHWVTIKPWNSRSRRASLHLLCGEMLLVLKKICAQRNGQEQFSSNFQWNCSWF